MRTDVRHPLWLCLLGLAFACANPDPLVLHEGPNAKRSNDGTYFVRCRTIPAEVPYNESFDVELEILDARTGAPVPTDRLSVDARMPAHRHGMRQTPETELGEDGRASARGLLFHMFGHWELYVDITDGAVTERAQFDFELE